MRISSRLLQRAPVGWGHFGRELFQTVVRDFRLKISATHLVGKSPCWRKATVGVPARNPSEYQPRLISSFHKGSRFSFTFHVLIMPSLSHSWSYVFQWTPSLLTEERGNCTCTCTASTKRGRLQRLLALIEPHRRDHHKVCGQNFYPFRDRLEFSLEKHPHV